MRTELGFEIASFSFLALDQAGQNVNELNADHGLDQNRYARPGLVLIDLLAEHERQTEPNQSLHDAPSTFGALAAVQQCSGEYPSDR